LNFEEKTNLPSFAIKAAVASSDFQESITD
jgi:hypothetical protein